MALSVLLLALATPAKAQTVTDYTVEGDAVPASLTGKAGNAAAGRRIAIEREQGGCILCHRLPEVRFHGDIGPTLEGVAGRLSEGQIRLRVIDQGRINPATIMPPYHHIERLVRVGDRFRGRPVLTAEQVEDVVAYLGTLK